MRHHSVSFLSIIFLRNFKLDILCLVGSSARSDTGSSDGSGADSGAGLGSGLCF